MSMSLLHRYYAQQRRGEQPYQGKPVPRRENRPQEYRPGHPVTRPERSHPEPTNLEELKPAAERLGIKLEHVGHYATALARWTAAGFPTRTQAEVDACLAVCQTCEHYTDSGRCRTCGCGVNKSKIAVLNKAKMATEQCSEGKWPGTQMGARPLD